MDLFNLPESKSPRMKWMERHHLTVTDTGSYAERRFEAVHGMKTIGYGATPDQALFAAAKSLNIRMWNEQ